MGTTRIFVCAGVLAVGSGCAAVSAQLGSQTPGLPLDPEGPVEGGASVAGYAYGATVPEPPSGADGGDEVFWDVHASGHVRVPLTWGTSLRVSAGVGRQATRLAVGVVHPFAPRHPEARWNGIVHYGLGHAFLPAGLDRGWAGDADVTGYHDAFAGLMGHVRLGRGPTRWNLEATANVPIYSTYTTEEADPVDGTVLSRGIDHRTEGTWGELTLSTGATIFAPLDDRRRVFVKPEVGLGLGIQRDKTDLAFVFQVGVGVTQATPP